MIGRPATLLFLLAAGGFAQDPARLEQVVQSYVAGNHFMGTVLVAKGDQVILSKGYGSANLEWNIPNTPSTKFRLGSITKQFTAACILLLEERGKLKIEDPIRKYMADAPPAWDKITIYNVLTHTSGIPNFTSFPDYSTTEALPSSAEKTVSRFRDKPLDFEPGSKFSYSNSGYVLLGYLIEKISGQSYDKFLQENIFTPLEMKNPHAAALLHWIVDDVIAHRRARAFLLEAGRPPDLITTLFDARVLHVLKRNVSAHDQPGIRYDVYKMDYGCYVDLLTTGKTPLGLFQKEDGSYIEVPPDDYRAIRRAILDIATFEKGSE